MGERAKRPVPEGLHTLTPHLWFNGNCAEAMEFYQKVFASKELARMPGPDGKSILHGMIKIGDSNIMLADAWPAMFEQGPDQSSTVGLFIYTEDCDAMFDKACRAGCEVIAEMMDAFWGDRMGKIKDPFGHCWAIATHKWDYTTEEIANGQKEWLESMK